MSLNKLPSSEHIFTPPRPKQYNDNTTLERNSENDNEDITLLHLKQWKEPRPNDTSPNTASETSIDQNGPTVSWDWECLSQTDGRMDILATGPTQER